MSDCRTELIKKMARAAFGKNDFLYLKQLRAALAVAEPVIREQADAALREENARLREALKPFAGMAQHCEGMSDSESQCVFVGDLRAARAAIREGGKDEN